MTGKPFVMKQCFMANMPDTGRIDKSTTYISGCVDIAYKHLEQSNPVMARYQL